MSFLLRLARRQPTFSWQGRTRHGPLKQAWRDVSSGEAKNAVEEKLPTKELKRLFLCSAIPMVGFGIMDNVIMIQAGDLIDNTLGVRFGLATLTAAAFGQLASDSCGVGFGGAVDAMVAKLGLTKPNLTAAQLQLGRARLVSTGGGVVGVIIGCCIGMLSLLFLDLEAAEREKEERKKEELRDTVAIEVRQTIGAERSMLWVLQEDDDESKPPMLVGKLLESGEHVHIPHNAGIVGLAVETKKTQNVHDVTKHSSFKSSLVAVEGFTLKNNLSVPIVSPITNKVLGVLQLLNKVDRPYFSDTDAADVEQIATFLAYELEGEQAGFKQTMAVLSAHRKS